MVTKTDMKIDKNRSKHLVCCCFLRMLLFVVIDLSNLLANMTNTVSVSKLGDEPWPVIKPIDVTYRLATRFI